MADDYKSTCPHDVAPWDDCPSCDRDADGSEESLLDALKWEMSGGSVPEDASREELKDLLKRYTASLEIVKGKIREKTSLRKEWNGLRRRIATEINGVEEELRLHNIEQKFDITDEQLGNKMISAAIGCLRSAGWTVLPPDKEEG